VCERGPAAAAAVARCASAAPAPAAAKCSAASGEESAGASEVRPRREGVIAVGRAEANEAGKGKGKGKGEGKGERKGEADGGESSSLREAIDMEGAAAAAAADISVLLAPRLGRGLIALLCSDSKQPEASELELELASGWAPLRRGFKAAFTRRSGVAAAAAAAAVTIPAFSYFFGLPTERLGLAAAEAAAAAAASAAASARASVREAASFESKSISAVSPRAPAGRRKEEEIGCSGVELG
jgi:hypothetical protein